MGRGERGEERENKFVKRKTKKKNYQQSPIKHKIRPLYLNWWDGGYPVQLVSEEGGERGEGGGRRREKGGEGRWEMGEGGGERGEGGGRRRREGEILTLCGCPRTTRGSWPCS
jgi:hypothetical protein